MDLRRADIPWTPCHGIVGEAEFDNTCSPGRGSIPAFGGFAPNPTPSNPESVRSEHTIA